MTVHKMYPDPPTVGDNLDELFTCRSIGGFTIKREADGSYTGLLLDRYGAIIPGSKSKPYIYLVDLTEALSNGAAVWDRDGAW